MEESGALLEELRAFGLKPTNDSVLDQLFQLSLKWNIDDVSLAEKYVAFQRNSNLSDEITKQNIDCFDREMSSKLESVKLNPTKIPLSTPAATNILPHQMLEELMVTKSQNEQHDLFSSYMSDAKIPKRPSQLPVTPSSNKGLVPVTCKGLIAFVLENISDSQLSQSASSGALLCSFPAVKTDVLRKERAASSVWDVTDLAESTLSTRYMHQPTLEKAEILDNWAWGIVKKIITAMPDEIFDSVDSDTTIVNSQPTMNASFTRTPIKTSNSQPVTKSLGTFERENLIQPTWARQQSNVLVAGRIAAHEASGAAVGREGDKTDLDLPTKQRLQSSTPGLMGLRRIDGVRTSSDGMTRLEFTASQRVYSLHAGQPVVLRAANPTGQLLGVTEVFQCPPSTPSALEPPKSDLDVMIACGPFTPADSNDPSILLGLLRAVKERRPHMLILVGPFVDCNHPAAQTYCETTYEELFQNRMNSVAEYCSHLDVQIVLVPSWREMHHHPVYPTPPLDRSWTEKTPELVAWYKNVHFVWDPCLVRVGGCVFGITSVDVLFDLSGEEISSGCSGDRIARLCRHLLNSETFYPIHPPADDLPLDYILWDQCARITTVPHCLIIPSRLRQFTKDVDGVLCLNPGHVSRGAAAGSYACMTVHSDRVDDVTQTEKDGDPSVSACANTSATVHRL